MNTVIMALLFLVAFGSGYLFGQLARAEAYYDQGYARGLIEGRDEAQNALEGLPEIRRDSLYQEVVQSDPRVQINAL